MPSQPAASGALIIKNGTRWSLVAAFAFIAVAGAFVYLEFFRDSWQPPQVVTIEGSKPVWSLFTSYPMWGSDAEEGASQALLLRDGDYMLFSDFDVPVRYLASDGPALKMTFNDWSASLGETIIALSLDSEDGRKWFNSASDAQLAELRIVAVPEDVDAGTLAALKRLAATNPNVDLSVESGAALRHVLPLFEPRAVFAGEEEGATLELLANQPQLEMLLISASKPGSLDFLPTLPRLRRLFLGEWDIAQAGPLPAGLTGLKSLVVFESEAKDLSALSAAPAGLEELSLMIEGPNDMNLAGLDKFASLRTLILWVDNDSAPLDLSSLAALEDLRWAGLPPETSQEQFAAIVSAHPKLTILEMMMSENVKDLAPLRGLKALQGLVLGGAYENLEVLQELTSLRFVGISKKTWEESPAQVAAVRKALPDAVVVRVSPFCLGSGWILLLVPVLGFAWLRRSSPRLVRQAA